MKTLSYFIIFFSLMVFVIPHGFAQDTLYYPGMQSRKILVKAKKEYPGNHAISYYLGWTYFIEGNQEAAIDEWDSYLKKYPDNDWAKIIRQQLTLIKVNQSAAYARKTAKQDPLSLSGRIKQNRVVILNFKNRSYSGLNGLSKGLAQLIITDLSMVTQLKVVSRMRMQALIHETQLEQPGIVDRETAFKIGRLLLSGYAVWGEFTDISESDLDILVRITETSSAKEIGKLKAKGPMAKFNMLEKKIVFSILSSLNIKKENLDPMVLLSINRNHFNDFSAFMDYSKGLDFLDKRQFEKAKEAFKKAIRTDPTFKLAKRALTLTPRDTIFPTFIEPEIFPIEKEPQKSISIQRLPDIDIDAAHEQMLMNVLKNSE